MLLCSKFWVQIYDWRACQIIQRNWQKRSRETNLTPPRETGTDLHQGWTTLHCLCAVTASQTGFPSVSALVSLLVGNWAFGKSLWGLILALHCLLNSKTSFPLALRSDCISTASLALHWCCGSLCLCWCVLSGSGNLPTGTTTPHCNEESLRSDLRPSTAQSK